MVFCPAINLNEFHQVERYPFIDNRHEQKRHIRGAWVKALQKTIPEGCMRNVLTDEFQTKDRENYQGTVTYSEAKYNIFMGALDLSEDLLQGIQIQFVKEPTITFKLTEQIDIDTLSDVEYFKLEREPKQRTEHLGCKIKGLRQRRPALTSRRGRRTFRAKCL